jgi:hypothetical protein
MPLKIVSTKPAKRASGFALLLADMQFASRVFGIAAKLEKRTPEQIHGSRPSLDARQRQLLEFDPFLRAGATVAQVDGDVRNDSEATKAALFEAGVITYGRCFNSGARTQLSKNIFRGPLASAKKTHETLMEIRNKHVAHSELKMERSIVGCTLVDDKNYGERPNLVMSVLAIRRDVPSDERLTEFQTHCDLVVSEEIYPEFLATGSAVRDQLLLMPLEQIERLPDFATEPVAIDEIG